MFDEDDLILIVSVIIIIIFIIISIYFINQDEKEWQKYTIEHHCIKVGLKEGSTSTGITMNGKPVTNYNPSQDIYQCDNGEIRIR